MSARCNEALVEIAAAQGDAAAIYAVLLKLEAEAAGQVSSGWQPIETAPRPADRQEPVIVAERVDSERWAVGEAYWEPDREAWFWINTHWTDAHGYQIYPEFWQPMPAPPPSAGEVG